MVRGGGQPPPRRRRRRSADRPDPVRHRPVDAGADVLAALPVLCFGALAPLAPALASGSGREPRSRARSSCCWSACSCGSLPGLAFLFVGTAIAGTAIAVANVLLPVLVRSNFPDRVGLLTGMYSTTLIGFAALAAGVSVPVADAFGGGWRPALAIWAIPAAVALAVWAPQLRRRRGAAVVGAGHVAASRRSSTTRSAWSVTLFFGVQSAGTPPWPGCRACSTATAPSTSAAGFLLSTVAHRRPPPRAHRSHAGHALARPAPVRDRDRQPDRRRLARHPARADRRRRTCGWSCSGSARTPRSRSR